LSNTVIKATPDVISKFFLEIFKNNLVFAPRVTRKYEVEIMSPKKTGGVVNIKKQLYVESEEGSKLKKQTFSDQLIQVEIDRHRHVGLETGIVNKTLTIDDLIREIKASAVELAHQVENSIADLYVDIPNVTGTAGTTPASFEAFANVNAELSRLAVPIDGRMLAIDPAAEVKAATFLTGFNNAAMVDSSVRDMAVGRIGGMTVNMSQNVKYHTAGGGSSYAVNGSNQGVDGTIIVKTGTGTLLKGDVITIAGVNSVNPVSREDTGVTRKFVLTADYDGGAGTISVSPSVITSGANQNVSIAVPDSAAITLVATHRANIAFTEDTFALAMVQPERPESAKFWSTASEDGFIITLSQDYDIVEYSEIMRFDVLWGVKTLRPDSGIRLLG
jgi:hypothetical protein